jgi:AraC-like DNA-binding protein
MIYQRFRPAAALAPFVECYWYLRRAKTEGEGVERILPDGCTELIFNLRAPFRVHEAAGTVRAQPCALLVGQISRCLQLEPTGDAEILAVRFTPAGAAAFFPFAMAEITDGHAAAGALGAPWNFLEDRLQDDRTTAARLRRIETALLKSSREQPVSRVTRAVARLQECAGQLRIGDLARETGLSTRQLEREFTRRVGLTPKQFARIVRFQRVLRAMSEGGQGWADVAAECGFTDQAHLVNEFRALSGLSPREHFRRETAMGLVFLG